MIGIVQYWNRERGFGFVLRTDCDEQVFFNIREVKNAMNSEIKRGTLVEYELEEGKKATLVCVNVHVIKDE